MENQDYKLLFSKKGNHDTSIAVLHNENIDQYVVAWNYDEKTNSWGQGHYFEGSELVRALNKFNSYFENNEKYDYKEAVCDEIKVVLINENIEDMKTAVKVNADINNDNNVIDKIRNAYKYMNNFIKENDNDDSIYMDWITYGGLSDDLIESGGFNNKEDYAEIKDYFVRYCNMCMFTPDMSKINIFDEMENDYGSRS